MHTYVANDFLVDLEPTGSVRVRIVQALFGFRDWSSGLISSQIISLIYIDFDELE